MKTKTLSLAICAALSLAAQAENPRWMRQCAISPDGKSIAFCYKGDIYTVDSKGGEAKQLTTHSAYDTAPVWSPDGKKLAFASDREGSLDVYVMSREGGVPTRLTATTGKETPVAWQDNATVLYLASQRPSVEDMQFPSGFSHVYAVQCTDDRMASKTTSYAVPRSRMVSSMPMESISISADGKTWLYHDNKGYEDPFRKHHTSPIARDVWSYSPAENKYVKQTTFSGEDRNPVWGNGSDFYYLSEESGTFNIHKRSAGTSTKLTSFSKNPVRFLTRSADGTLCFGQNGDIYTMKEGSQPQKLAVTITSDASEKDIIRKVQHSGVTDYAVAPSGKEIAFVLHGDVYVTSTEYSTTRQITDTPDQERSVDFAPDGKSVIYASERKGLWQIYRTSIVGDDDKQLTYAKQLKEENITNTDQTSFQPSFSPDGKKIAYIENRTTLRVIDLKSKKTTTALEGKFNYSYSDGDQNYTWSPDSKWLLSNYIGVGGWNNPDIALVKCDGSEVHNLTQSGYSDGNAKWVLGGKAMVWGSDRAGYRSHGSWGAEDDYYIMFFDVEAYDKFVMNKEDKALAEEAKTDKEKKQEEKKEEKKEKAKEKGKPEEVEELKFDLVNAKDRIIRLTVNSANLGDAVLSNDGTKFYYMASFESGYDLWCHNLEDESTTKVVSGMGYGSLDTDEKGETVYFSSGGGLKKLKLGDRSPESISFEAIFNYRPAQERAYIFDHVWRQVNEKFYDTKIHGIDWQYYRDNYEQFLPYINNNYDFADLLSEMLGELNGSHTGARYRPGYSGLSVASLGLFYDDTFDGSGLKIKEIMPKSPLTLKKNDVKAGDVITKINGISITDSLPADYLLAGQVGKSIALTIQPSKGKEYEVSIKGISSGAESELLYHRWVERNRHIVDSLSSGKLGYIHIEGMDSKSFRVLYSELLGRYRNCEAVIIDTRHNGGGWLHDDVITLLGAKEYTRYTPRGQYIGSDPYNKWTKPSCMLICEDNYSNAHGTPWLYKELGIGKLIGTPVPGTMTAVWWENQIDPTLVFGIPQVGAMDNRGNFLENQTLNPDILIYNDPADVLRGKDAQLEGAVKEMLSQIAKK